MLGSPPRSLRTWAGDARQRLRDMLRDQWQPMAAFLLLLFSVELARGWSVANHRWADLAHFATIDIAPIFAILGSAALLGPVLAAVCCRSGWARALLTIALTVGSVGTGVWILDTFRGGPISAAVREGRVLSDEAFALRSLWFYSAAGLLFAGYRNVRERHMAVTRATQAAEIERAAARRAVIESRLKVLQARVEPDFLFGALDHVDALYRRSPADAERMLDDLIRYLRVALPKMRGDGSTIGRELELVGAYLKLLEAPRGRIAAVAIDCAPGLASVCFPPMALLGAVRECSARHRKDGVLRIAIDVRSGHEQLRIAIDVTGDDVPTMPTIPTTGEGAGLAETIAGTCGSGSAVAFTVHGCAQRATIVVPTTKPAREAA